jgi:nicotinate-nucleotide adenylyltransferase
MKIGICGGTFDPFHRGHLDPVLAVRERVQWDRVIYIPAHVQPFKQDREFASGYHRFAMVSLAILDHDALVASPMELERGRVSYSVETLEALRETYPDATVDWIIGDDNLAALTEWKSLDRIFQLANFVVLSRGGARVVPSLEARVTKTERRPAHGAIAFAENATLPISSTEIRRRVRDGEPFEELVPSPVSRYIHHYGLYRKGQA